MLQLKYWHFSLENNPHVIKTTGILFIIYLIRKGLVEAEFPHPRGRVKKARAVRKVREVFGSPLRTIGSLTQEEASEILLVARWFRLRGKELAKTRSPEDWLDEFGSAA